MMGESNLEMKAGDGSVLESNAVSDNKALRASRKECSELWCWASEKSRNGLCRDINVV